MELRLTTEEKASGADDEWRVAEQQRPVASRDYFFLALRIEEGGGFRIDAY